jgi:hypothetical protein
VSESKYPLRKSKIYWICGGDVFWYHFRMEFLKKALIFLVGFSLIINLVRGITGELFIDVLAGLYLLFILGSIALIYKNSKVANFVLREKSKASDAQWILIFISSLCILMLALLPFGYVQVA